MVKNLLFFFLFFVLCSGAYSQNFTWAKQIGMQGNTSDDAYFVASDAIGNVYIAGTYKHTTDFDPGPGTVIFSNNGGSEIVISKLDPSGIFLWGKHIGGTAADIARNMCADATGDIIIAGNFCYTVDFDPGPGVYNLTGNPALERADAHPPQDRRA